MHLGQRTGKSLGLLRRQRCLPRPHTLLALAIEPEAGVGQSSISQSKIGILVDRLLEQRSGLPQLGGVMAVA